MNQEDTEQKIEITPEMIEAGLRSYSDWEARYSDTWGGSIILETYVLELIKDIYLSMNGSKPSVSKNSLISFPS